MRHQTTTQRDVEVVMDIYKYRYLKSSQIRALHFPSLQTTNRRLRSLCQNDLIRFFIIPNIPERIYQISRTGAHIVAEQLGVDVNELLWSKNTHCPKDYYFMRHFLAVNQFRIELTKACQSSNLELLGFIPEYFGTKHQSGKVTKYIKDFVFDVQMPSENISHTPDAVFALMKGNKPALFFLEVDRGTEVLTNPEKGFLKMIRFYFNYAQSNKFKSYEQDFKCSDIKVFRVLIVTTTSKRLENMRQAVCNMNDSSANILKFIWLTSEGEIYTNKLFQRIWKSLKVEDNEYYCIG